MNFEAEFRNWLKAEKIWIPKTIEFRILSLRLISEDGPYNPEDTTVRGVYQKVWGALPPKKAMEIEDPDEFMKYFGIFADKANRDPDSDAWKTFVQQVGAEKAEFLKEALKKDHNSLTSAARVYRRFLNSRKSK